MIVKGQTLLTVLIVVKEVAFKKAPDKLVNGKFPKFCKVVNFDIFVIVSLNEEVPNCVK